MSSIKVNAATSKEAQLMRRKKERLLDREHEKVNKQKVTFLLEGSEYT